MTNNEKYSFGQIMTLSEVADYLQIHPTTLYRLVSRGEMPGFRVGGSWRFDLESIENLVAQKHR